MNEKSWKPIIIKGWGGTVPRPYIPVAYVPTCPMPDDRLPRPPKPEEKQI